MTQAAGTRRAPFVLLETANLLSGVGNGVALVVLPWLVLERTGSATAAGFVAAATVLPLLVSSLFAGTVVDVVGRKATSIGSDVMSGLSVAAIPLLDLAGGLNMWSLIALAMLGAVFDPAGFTAREAMLPAAATAAGWRWDRANGVHEAVFGAAYLFGPGLGGLLIGLVGPLTALWATAIGFGISIVVTAFIRVADAGRPPAHERPASVWHGTVEGLTFVWNQRLLRVSALLICAVVAVYLPLESVIFPVYFQAIDAPEQLGIVVTALSAGGIVGSLAAASAVDRFGRRRVFVWSIVGACLAILGLVLFPPFWAMVVLAVMTGLLYGPVQPILNLAMQVLSPERLRGRVVGVLGASAYAAGPLGLLIAGPLVEWLGVEEAALGIGVALFLTALAGFMLPTLRELDHLDTEPAQSS